MKKRTRTLRWLLVIILATTLLFGCNAQPNDQKPDSDLSYSTQTVTTAKPTLPSGKSFRFEEVEVFQTWPLPASLVAQIEAKELTYDQLWEILFDWLPEAARQREKDIPVLRTPEDGKYYFNQFYIHPAFDRILGKGVPREKVGVFFVKEFEEEMVNVMSGEPIGGDKLVGFYISCKLNHADVDQPFIRLLTDSSITFMSGDCTQLVQKDYIRSKVEGWVDLPQQP